MRQTFYHTGIFAFLVFFQTSNIHGGLPPANPDDPIRIVQKMLVSIRLNKTDMALTFIGTNEIASYLLDSHYKELTETQKKQFTDLIGEYIKLRAFPLAIKYISDIGISYDKPSTKNNKIYLKSSVVYNNSEKLLFTWVLKKQNEKLLIVDFLNEQNQSSMKKNRDLQILPSYRKRGAVEFLNNFEKVVEKLKH